jgi:epothilone synthetase B
MEKGWEQVAAVLGVLMSGAAYVPVQASWPAERVALLLQEGKVELVLTQPEVLSRLELPRGVQALGVHREMEGGGAPPAGEGVDEPERLYIRSAQAAPRA